MRARAAPPEPGESLFDASDVRFTTKGDTLYAISLGWPCNELVIHSLAVAAGGSTNRVKQVRMLGVEGWLPFSQDAQGVRVTMPRQRPCDHAISLAITVGPA